jgi:hypothetical protein
LAAEKNEERKAKLLEAIENGSVMTWAHFNLHGEFDFSDEKMQDSVGLLSPKFTTVHFFERWLKNRNQLIKR